MSFSNDYKKYLDKVESWIQLNIGAFDGGSEKRIYEAMLYSIKSGGKRLRPVLSLAVCDMLGEDQEAVLPFACALELIHTYSLIHDDLPCMDDDDFRRGVPTNHKVFGEAMAVLAGDGLLNLAFEIMLKEAVKEDRSSLKRSRAALLVANSSGTAGMIGGQVIDMESEGCEISYELLCSMHEKKTGALIKAAVLIPAELFGISPKIKEALDIYAENIGLAFQIKDDILDFEGNSNIVGKPVGSDTKNNKATFVTILGIKKAKELLKTTVERAVEAMKGMEETDFLIKTAVYIAERDK